MNLELKFRKLAQNDLIEQYDYIQIGSVDAAERFLIKVQETLRNILEFPEMGRIRISTRQGLHIIRFIPVNDFAKHLIFYRPSPTKISVLRVLHSSRDINKILGL